MNDSYEAKLNAHYGRAAFGQLILDWLKANGKDLTALTVEDLALADQHHGGGFASTISLAELAEVKDGMRVADLGGGIGGPARYLATKYGATVDVVDLAAEFCSSGELLTKTMHLEGRLAFRNESATKTSLPSSAYDLVWMQNASMNIEDRTALYAEVKRLLRPGGHYAFQEAMAGDAGPATYPTNWATTQDESFLRSPEYVLRALLDAGFRALAWIDETRTFEAARNAQLANRLQATTASVPMPFYLEADKFRVAAANVSTSTAEGRLRYGRGLFEKL